MKGKSNILFRRMVANMATKTNEELQEIKEFYSQLSLETEDSKTRKMAKTHIDISAYILSKREE